MEEEKKIEQNNNTQSEIKEAIDKELSSYINQESTNTTIGKTISDNTTPNITEQKPKVISRPIIRTYRSDAEQTIKTGHISSINIAIAESNKILRNSQDKQESNSEIKRININKTFIIISLVLVFGGFSSFFISFLLFNKQNNTGETVEENISEYIMTTDVTEKININDLNLNRVSTTLKERVDQSSIKPGQIKNFYLVDKNNSSENPIDSIKFLNLIKANIPTKISSTIKPQFIFGMHNINNNTQRLLIIKTGSYDLSFSGMLSWETYLWQDFKELFSLKDNENSTTSSSYNIEVKKFQDEIFNNKDCRVVKNSLGEIIFLYSVINKNTIGITTSVETMKEIITRINKASITQ